METARFPRLRAGRTARRSPTEAPARPFMSFHDPRRTQAVEADAPGEAAALERMADGFFAVDRDWRLTYLNPETERSCGTSRAAVLGGVLWEAFPELAGTPLEEAYRRAVREQAPAHLTAPAPGGARWVEVHAYPSPHGLSVYFRDATEARRADDERAALLARERAARARAEAAERRLRELVEGVGAVVWEARAEPLAFTFVSGHARELLGHPVERWSEPGFWERAVHPDDFPRVAGAYRAAARDGRERELEYRVRTAAGRERWVRDVARAAPGPGGAELRGVMVDVTDEKRSGDEARRLAAIVESTSDAVVATSLSGTVLTWNAAAERMFGWREGEMVGESVFRLIPEDRHAEERQILRAVAAGERVTHRETERLRRNGARITVSLTVSPILDPAGRIAGASTIARDITGEKRLEAQVRQAAKMEAVGRLAGGVAHDFNNLLTAIRGNASLLLEALPPGDPAREEAGEIERAARRAAELTRQLLAFSRRQVLQPRVLSMNAVVGDLQRMLRRLIEEDVALEVKLDSTLWPVRADPGQIEQVLVNLVVNARDAVGRGGRVTVSTSNAAVAEAGADGVPFFVPPGEYARVEVADTGAGMGEDVLGHLFEPFFTTKPQGTGLGLSTVYGIVKQSGGYVWAESRPGAGSRFTVLLPRVHAALPAPEAPAPPAPRPAPRPAAGTVLLVEDEEAVRGVARRTLARAGYTVLEAHDGPSARALFAAHSVDLLLTDVVMPGASGPELARALSALRPGVAVLYMSGYAGATASEEHGLPPGAAFIEKPFSPHALAERVRALIEATRGAAERRGSEG